MTRSKTMLFLFTAIICFNAAAQTGDAKMKSLIDALMKKMTLDEKIGQLNLLTIGIDVTGPVLSKDITDGFSYDVKKFIAFK